MSIKYFCPDCKSMLNPSKKVVFCIEKDDKRHLILLDPRPGNYTRYLGDDIKLNKGDVWEFFCPVCHFNLHVDEDNDKPMAMVLCENPKGKNYKMIFSRQVYTHASFIIDDAEMKSFGTDSFDYEYLVKNKFF